MFGVGPARVLRFRPVIGWSEEDGAEGLLHVVVERDGELAVVQVEGELDVATAPRLAQHLDALLAEQPQPRVVLHCEALEFCDSIGLSTLLRAAGARPGGAPLVLRRPHENVQRVLDLAGVEHVFELDPPPAP